MRAICLRLQYEGTNFFGFQSQPGKRTIQGVLEETLSNLVSEEIAVYGSGRTDRGVHALGQMVHFHTKSPIPPAHFAYVLRRMLPDDLLVLESYEVPLTFHARKDACWKTYRYQIDSQRVPDLFQRRYHTHVPGLQLDLQAMKQAANFLLGEHDFTSFCSPKTTVLDRRRTLYQLLIQTHALGWQIEITGNGFLYNMVRIIVGTLIQIGKGERSAEQVPNILQARDRQAAGPTMPPEGLILMEVGYQPWMDEN
ncbi:tRNA pseudouridine38-40 synthase [Seinonella peptonophila]|uniref:tRNA pseudouridine synthase A n=1 Tax=Seinonella peptonophila TaxID=112248 RepID=A0A1M4YXM8_9BACL|nr:tRNA pseudouridine(38-40) synthase TruA [Seinonella peptonophila]SHF10500.1 tRNA pseudouridine38-40 synthase [Seinonella peptonophila]